MADRHTAQTVLAALAARGRTVTDASDTSASVGGVRLEFTRTRCTVAGRTVPLGVYSPRGRTVEMIDAAIDAAIAREERRRQDAQAAAEWRRKVEIAASLTARFVTVRARYDDTFTITVEPVPESALADIVAFIRTRLGEDHA